MIKKKRSKWPIIVVVLLLGGGGAAVAVSRSKGHAPEGEVVTVNRGIVKVAVQEVGSIEPFRKIDIKSKVAGQVMNVLVDVGAEVKAGATLIRLEPLDAERDVRQSEARLAITQSQLDQAKGQAAFKRKAHENGALSEIELAVAEGEVKRLQGQRALEEVQFQVARDRQSYTQLKSPIDGVVLARNVQPGEMVTPGVSSMVDGKPLLVVAQMEKLLVRTELNQIDVARLKLGAKVEVKVDALPGQQFEGEIYRIAAMAQKSERRKESNLLVFPVDVVVARSQPGADNLRPGMIADITIGLDAKSDVLTVPLEAIVRQDGKTQLWKVTTGAPDPSKGDIATDVVVGLQNERVAEIVSGITEGDKIRIRPADASGQTAKM